jgi:zinc protease
MSVSLRRLVIGFAGIAMLSHARGADPELVTTVEGISEYRLDNGLRVLLFPDPSKPQVTVNLTIFVGSRHEGYGEAGMAHLLEHMLFKGTPTHPEVPKVLKDHGADYNGTTWLDRTNYYETLPASDENLRFAIALEADRMVNSFVRGEDLASEMTVVRNEFERGENDPSRVLSQRLFAAAYDWHNYGKSTIGNRADIERVPIESLRKFYRWHYQPDNALLIVAGQFDPDKALEHAQTYFGAIPRPQRVLDATYTEEPAQDGARLVRLQRVGDVAQVGALWHIPAGPHPDYIALDVLEHVMTATPSGRLYQKLVMTRQASSVSGAAYSLHDPGVLKFSAQVTPGNDPEAVLATLLDVAENVAEEPVTQQEVDRARVYWMKTWEQAFSDSARLAVQLSDWAAQGDWRLIFLYRDRLETVTPEQVNEAANKYITANNRTAGLFIPTAEPRRISVPPAPSLADIVGGYQGREAIAEGEMFDVGAANVDARTVRRQLSTGLKVALIPKRTRGHSIRLRLTLRYGTPGNLQGFNTAAEVLPSLMVRGAGDLTRQDIQDKLDLLKSTLAQSGSAGEMTFTLETRRESLHEVLALLGTILRKPTLPEDELEIIRNSMVSSYKQQLTDPMSLARNAVSRRLSDYPPEDVRYVASIPEQVSRWESVTRGDAATLYSEFLGGQNGELAIVGDFDVDEALPDLEALVAGWTTPTPYERISKTGDVDVGDRRDAILTPDKDNAVYLAGTVLPISDTHPDYPALLMGNYILGSSGLASRLGDRVRQKEGLSYGVGSFISASAIDSRGTLLLYAITNPANVAKVETAMREELARLIAEGVTQEELDAARTGYIQNQIVERAEDSKLAQLLADNTHAGRTMAYYSDLERLLLALTPADVQRALETHVGLDQIGVVVAGDFNKAVVAPPAAEGTPAAESP